VVSGLARAAGAKLVSTESSNSAAVATIAYRAKGATLLWLANLTAQTQTVTLAGVDGRAVFANTLDESSFEAATSDPRKFQATKKAVTGGKIALKAYGVAWVCVND
jgi:hypothetical protein